MNIIRTDKFERMLKSLSATIKQLYATQESRFKADPRDQRLHIKKVHKLPNAFSFRVTRNFRVFFYFHTQDTVIFFAIDDRKDIYRNI